MKGGRGARGAVRRGRAVQVPLQEPRLRPPRQRRQWGCPVARAQVEDLFRWVDAQDKGTHLWSVIFDATGGRIADVPAESTAYAHRDKFMFYQSYGVNVYGDNAATRDFLTGFHEKLLSILPDRAHGTYPGFVDPELQRPQEAYWMGNLPKLERIKAKWDPTDLFHNPGSVRPVV